MDNQQQYSLVHSAHNSFLQDPIQTSQFKIGLFEIGDLNSCIYSFTCCRCAVAQSRLFLDIPKYKIFIKIKKNFIKIMKKLYNI